MAEENGKGKGVGGAIAELTDHVRNSQVWTSIFRPGSPMRAGYSDTPRNRSYVIMNNVLYHLHPVKVKRHGVRLSYTLCLGGLSFFLFIIPSLTCSNSMEIGVMCIICQPHKNCFSMISPEQTGNYKRHNTSGLE